MPAKGKVVQRATEDHGPSKAKASPEIRSKNTAIDCRKVDAGTLNDALQRSTGRASQETREWCVIDTRVPRRERVFDHQ